MSVGGGCAAALAVWRYTKGQRPLVFRIDLLCLISRWFRDETFMDLVQKRKKWKLGI